MSISQLAYGGSEKTRFNPSIKLYEFFGFKNLLKIGLYEIICSVASFNETS